MHTKNYLAADGSFKKVDALSRPELEDALQRSADYQSGWADGHNQMVELMLSLAKAFAGHKA